MSQEDPAQPKPVKKPAKPKATKADDAKKTAKAAKLKDPEAKALIRKYFQDQNRPYNSLQLEQNLHGQIAKAQSVKLVEELVTEGALVRKDNKKQKIFWTSQQDLPTADPQLTLSLQQDITSLAEKSKNLDMQIRELGQKLGELEAGLPDDQLESQLAEFEQAIPALKAKLAAITPNQNCVTPRTKKRLEQQFTDCKGEFRKRRNVCMTILGQIGEGTGKSRAALMEEMGIETDADAGYEEEDSTTKRRKLMVDLKRR